MAPFNIRALTIVLGIYNTHMGNAAVLGKNPLPDDYKRSVADQTIQFISSDKIFPNGYKDMAMKAVYEVMVGEGAGISCARPGGLWGCHQQRQHR